MKLLLAALLAGITSIASAADGWLTDFQKAKKIAKEENKPILLDFTGSDWCPPCMRLDKEVFSNPKFKEIAAKYVLVKVDFPRSKPQSDELRKQNEELQAYFRIQGYPTVIVLDPTVTKAGVLFPPPFSMEEFGKALEEATPRE